MTILFVLSALCAEPEGSPVRYWVDESVVRVGRAFWIHIEVTGKGISIPERLKDGGVVIDPINVRQSTFHSPGAPSGVKTIRRSYSARALRQGPFSISPVQVTVNGEVFETESIELTAITTPPPAASGSTRSDSRLPAPKEDLVFIKMEVDRREVYQGEPIFFQTQLWRILYQNVDSGPYRESRIELPTTVGFFVADIDPLSFVGSRNNHEYDVWEERMILYPIDVGDLTIGRWHWEGVALINRRRSTRRERMYYDLDVGPIPITVKAIPEGPPEFSGGVGEFMCSASIGETRFIEGVPVGLNVTIYGEGNPFAIGEPRLPSLKWAQIVEVKRGLESKFPEERQVLEVSKHFSYSLTPLRSGAHEMPPVTYTFFSPSSGDFKTVQSESFSLNVRDSNEEVSPLVAAVDVPLENVAIEILGADIQPALPANTPLRPRGNLPLAALAIAALPVLAYVGIVQRSTRKKRLPYFGKTGSRSRALALLNEAAASSDPADTIYGALSGYIADAFGLESSGLSSSDLETLLRERGLHTDAAERLIQVYATCERARYASEGITDEEMRKLLQSAEQCIHELNQRLSN